MNIADQPTFNCWVPHVLKKREQIIAMTKQRNARNWTRKFGITIPITLWADAIARNQNADKIARNAREAPLPNLKTNS